MKLGINTSLVDDVVFGVRLAHDRPSLRRDDGAADEDRRRGASDVDIALPDGEPFTDAGGRAEHDFDDLLELTIRRRARNTGVTTPGPGCPPNRLDLVVRERDRLRRRLLHPLRLSDRVLRNRLVTGGQPEDVPWTSPWPEITTVRRQRYMWCV
ncbi:hypothetical protein [Nocardioides aequoreus]|uniref:hypothetical protein n=1 Tax=Nocardioides aequoreus TaxID=397278 RepID=UPI0004C2CAD2|nr:hypothetical protein [Nocardioides aequoreus]